MKANCEVRINGHETWYPAKLTDEVSGAVQVEPVVVLDGDQGSRYTPFDVDEIRMDRNANPFLVEAARWAGFKLAGSCLRMQDE